MRCGSKPKCKLDPNTNKVSKIFSQKPQLISKAPPLLRLLFGKCQSSHLLLQILQVLLQRGALRLTKIAWFVFNTKSCPSRTSNGWNFLRTSNSANSPSQIHSAILAWHQNDHNPQWKRKNDDCKHCIQ